MEFLLKRLAEINPMKNRKKDDSASIKQLLASFQSEEECINQLVQMKWPAGFHCDRCGCKEAYRTITRRLPLFECTDCRYQASPIVGTILEGSRTPLRKWFLALHLISQDVINTNATELSQIIKVTYKTGWLILHKIRHAIGEEDAQNKLTGNVSVTSAVYGSSLFYQPYVRYPRETPVLVGATINTLLEPEYVKIKIVPDDHLDAKSVKNSGTIAFSEVNIEESSTTNYMIKRSAAKKLCPTSTFFNDSRNWLYITFGGIGKRHLQAYLNEFCYRENLRLRKSLSNFNELIQLCATTKTIKYKTLTTRLALF